MRLVWASVPQASKQNKQASQQRNKRTHQDFFSNFFFIIATGLGCDSASKYIKPASKPTKTQINTPRFLLKLVRQNRDWSETQFHKQTRENKQARENTLNFFLHNCDWFGIPFNSTYLPTYLPTSLPPYLPTYLPTYLPNLPTLPYLT